MGALQAIPADLPRTTWMRGLVANHKLAYKEELEDRELRAAVEDVYRNVHKGVRPRSFKVGELVMLADPKDIRAGHKLKGRGRGPWRIISVMRDAVNLKDACTSRVLVDP